MMLNLIILSMLVLLISPHIQDAKDPKWNLRDDADYDPVEEANFKCNNVHNEKQHNDCKTMMNKMNELKAKTTAKAKTG